ncbi:hypothetical protein J7K93_05795 [bacterium]|nr:hypothetical protein [bacterium]
MKLKIVVIFIVSVFFLQPALAQTVIKVKDPYVLLKFDKGFDAQKGDILYIYRNLENGKRVVVAKVSVMAVKKDLCAVKIIKKSKRHPLALGDLAKKPSSGISPEIDEQTFASVKKEQNRPASVSIINSSENRNHLITYLTASAGLVISGLGYYYYDQAGITASQHYSTTTEYENLVILTDKYDKRANYCFYIGGGLIAAGLLHYFLTNSTGYYPSTASYNIMPVTSPGFSGLSIAIPL